MVRRLGYLSFVVVGGCAAGVGFVRASDPFPGQVGDVSTDLAVARR